MKSLTDHTNQIPCETDAIHIPGKIQAHGFLISFEKENGIVRYVSENIYKITGSTAINMIGKRFSEIVHKNLLLAVEHAIINQILKKHQSVEVAQYTSNNDNKYTVIGHINEGLVTLEFEPKDEIDDFENQFVWLDNAQQNLRNKKSLDDLLNETLNELKKLTNFERLLIYKFHDDGSGKVISEIKEDKLESFLGLHFPAIDVPEAAREMFFQNWTRHITSVSTEDVKVLSQEDEPLDMSYTYLRSVSTCHTEYLQNMGVEASLVIALINDGKLWGLLNCHHTSPKFLGFHKRNLCQLFGRFLSLIIPTKEQDECRNFFNGQEFILDRAILNIHSSADFFKAFQKETPQILEKVDACGMILSLYGEITKVGQVPNDSIIKGLIVKTKWTPDSLSYKQEDNLRPLFKDKDVSALNGCCGYLSFRIPEMGNGCLILFRPEYAHTISWGGDPNYAAKTLNENEVLSPRASFKIFLEEQFDKAKKWDKHEITFLEHFISKLKDEIILFQGGELKKTTSILKTIYEHSMDSLFLIDLITDKIIDCNDQATSFFEVDSKQDIIGKTTWDFQLVDIPQVRKVELKNNIKNGQSIISEIEYKVGTDKIKWGSLHAKLINNNNQDVYLVRVIDISEKKNTEQKIYLKNEELLKLNKELDRFVYSSSHDLRAPITSLTGLFGIMEQLDDKDEIINLLRHGKKSLKRLDKFIHDILNYSRNTRLQVKTEILNLHELVEGIMADYRFMFTENPVEAKMDVDIKHEIVTDAYRIKVILNNIISNAFKYRNPYISDSYVHVIASIDEKTHQIIIKDNGLGIGQIHLEKVFDMFYRADDIQAGSGLGLYIVKEMIEKLGGTISLNSEVNKGSSFMIELPKSRAGLL